MFVKKKKKNTSNIFITQIKKIKNVMDYEKTRTEHSLVPGTGQRSLHSVPLATLEMGGC